jgi:hypothetical protein
LRSNFERDFLRCSQRFKAKLYHLADGHKSDLVPKLTCTPNRRAIDRYNNIALMHAGPLCRRIRVNFGYSCPLSREPAASKSFTVDRYS